MANRTPPHYYVSSPIFQAKIAVVHISPATEHDGVVPSAGRNDH